jgi:PKHD-type hydroxylase
MSHSLHVHQFRLLTPEAVQHIQSLLANAPFTDGRATATDAAKAVKNNLQIDLSNQTVLPQLQQIIGHALMNESRLHDTFYASRAYQFLFSKCETGMGYGKHVDSPVMGNPPVRTDLAMTVFLDDPSTYEGGELVICSGDREITYKPAAGEAVVYPCQYLHYVKEVTKGVRNVCVTWFQCSVRSAEQRQILTDIKQLHAHLAANDPQGEQAQLLLQTWSNLLRMWAEV